MEFLFLRVAVLWCLMFLDLVVLCYHLWCIYYGYNLNQYFRWYCVIYLMFYALQFTLWMVHIFLGFTCCILLVFVLHFYWGASLFDDIVTWFDCEIMCALSSGFVLNVRCWMLWIK